MLHTPEVQCLRDFWRFSSYNKDKETSYISYKSVPDQDGDYGDLNAGGGKQWLAIYQTHDRDAGDPILAPNGKQNPIIVQTGDSKNPGDYSPLHYFGTPNAAQNLTFADGENGWSYNDDEGGIYLFFTRDPNPYYGGSDDEAIGTSMSGGRAVLAVSIGAVIGLLVGAGGVSLIHRRKKRV